MLRTISLRLQAPLLAGLALTAACADPGADDLDGTGQPVYEGGLVPNNVAPYSSAISIFFPASSSEQCSGVKVGATRFYTAAHCTQGWVAGTKLAISNALDPGTSHVAPNWTVVSLKNVFVHPSYAADPQKFGRLSTDHSYDVAIFDTNESTSTIPAAGVRKTHFGDLKPFFAVGYGANAVFPAKAGKKQRGDFRTVNGSDNPARYAHQLLGDGGLQGLGGGDSGGPAFAVDTNEVIGLNENAPTTPPATGPFISGFARIANVGRWLDAPHNASLTTISGIGFLQQKLRQRCVVGGSLAVGQPISFGECEGYDPNIHAQLWNFVPVPRTSFFQVQTAKPGLNLCFDLSGRDVVLQPCDASRKEQQWAANAIGSDGLFYFVVNQKDPATGVRAHSVGHVSLRVGSATLGDDKNWMFYR
jgi:hypothetical protein